MTKEEAKKIGATHYMVQRGVIVYVNLIMGVGGIVGQVRHWSIIAGIKRQSHFLVVFIGCVK